MNRTEQIILINKLVTDEFGSPHGIKSDEDIKKASWIKDRMEAAIHIIKTKPFIDGNTRTALIMLKHEDIFDDDVERTIYENYDAIKLLAYN